MLGLFKEAMRFLKFDPVWIDNQVFRLHYKITTGLFFIASLLVTSRQYVGDPIDCMVDEIPSDMMDTYCWIHSTFSIPSRWVTLICSLRLYESHCGNQTIFNRNVLINTCKV